MNNEHFHKIFEIIKESDLQGPLVRANGLTGFSGDKVIGVLQRLASYQECQNYGCYLEIGVFQGFTLISVASVLKESIAFGIDNFAQFDPQQKNKSIIDERIRLNNLHNISLINLDYEDALEDLGKFVGNRKIGTYFIDGPHDYRSQLICLQMSKKYLSDMSIIIIDDCNYRHVRLANRDFLMANQEYKLLFEAYTSCHPKNMTKENEEKASKGWWNGINIIVHDPKDVLDRIYPPILRDRTLYENEHIVHSSKYGSLAPDAVSLISSIIDFRLIDASKKIMRYVLNPPQISPEFVGEYISMNTFSKELPDNRVNPTMIREL